MGIIGLIIALIINGAFASVASNIAAEKGYSKRGWFHACFWLPLITYILIAAMPDMELRKQNEEMIELQKELLVAITGGKCAPSTDTDVPDPFTE